MSACPRPVHGRSVFLAAASAFSVDENALNRVCAYLDDLRRGAEPAAERCAEWQRFYDRVDPVIRTLAARWLPAADCTDCAQQVWMVVVRRLHRFRLEGGNLEAWLAVLTRHAAADLLRHRSRRLVTALSRADEDALGGREPDPAAVYEQRHRASQVRHVLDELARRLSPVTFRVLHLRWVEGESVRAIAARTGLTEAQVYDRHLFAKRAFKDLWTRHNDEKSERA